MTHLKAASEGQIHVTRLSTELALNIQRMSREWHGRTGTPLPEAKPNHVGGMTWARLRQPLAASTNATSSLSPTALAFVLEPYASGDTFNLSRAPITSFSAATKTITINDVLIIAYIVADRRLIISGSTSNDGEYTAAATPTFSGGTASIIVKESLIDEAPLGDLIVPRADAWQESTRSITVTNRIKGMKADINDVVGCLPFGDQFQAVCGLWPDPIVTTPIVSDCPCYIPRTAADLVLPVTDCAAAGGDTVNTWAVTSSGWGWIQMGYIGSCTWEFGPISRLGSSPPESYTDFHVLLVITSPTSVTLTVDTGSGGSIVTYTLAGRGVWNRNAGNRMDFASIDVPLDEDFVPCRICLNPIRGVGCVGMTTTLSGFTGDMLVVNGQRLLWSSSFGDYRTTLNESSNTWEFVFVLDALLGNTFTITKNLSTMAVYSIPITDPNFSPLCTASHTLSLISGSGPATVTIDPLP